MERFTKLKEANNYIPDSGSLGALLRALRSEREIAAPDPYGPEQQGGIWLLEHTDTNENLAPSLSTSYEEHAMHYDEPDLWEKLRNLSKDAATPVMGKALLLRELLLDSRTPPWVMASAAGCLGYLLSYQ